MTEATPTPTFQTFRLTDRAYIGFTGELGSVEFVDGVTTTPYPAAYIDRLSANFGIVDAETGGAVGTLARMAGSNAIPFMAPASLDKMSEDQIAKANAAALEKVGKTVKPGQFLTEAELETIADVRGISGLREIAAPYGVRDKSITGLIEAILKAQAFVQQTQGLPQVVTPPASFVVERNGTE